MANKASSTNKKFYDKANTKKNHTFESYKKNSTIEICILYYVSTYIILINVNRVSRKMNITL